MTLAEFLTSHDRRAAAILFSSGLVVVVGWSDPGLWQLSDYVVSSVMAGGVYLCPR